MRSDSRIRLVAASGTYFAGALAQNVALNARIPLPESIGAGRNGTCLMRAIQVISVDNLAWEFWLWGNKLDQQTGNPAVESFLGFWSFDSTDGKQIGGTGNYYYYIDGLEIPYRDEDGPSNLGPQGGCFFNVTLVNRSAASKTNGAFFQAAFILDPVQGG